MRLKDKLAGCSHIEGVLRKATSNDPNPPKKESLSEMKSATYKNDQHELVMLMESILQRYKEDKAVWRHQYKTLIVHEYLLRHGSAKFVELSIKYKRFVETLERNGPPDPMNQIAPADREKVRELAQKVLALINDPHTLEAAKVRTSDPSRASRSSSMAGRGEDAELQRALALSKAEYESEQRRRGDIPEEKPKPQPTFVDTSNMTDEQLARKEQADLEAAIALSKVSALEEKASRATDEVPWWEANPRSNTTQKPLMEEANDIFDVFGSSSSSNASAPFAPPPRTGAAASTFASDPFGASAPPAAVTNFEPRAVPPPPAQAKPADPFGSSSPWGAPAAPAPAPAAASPFGAPAASDPWGTGASPFGASSAQPAASSPWGAPSSSPFGAPAANPTPAFAGLSVTPLEPAKSPVPSPQPARATQAPPAQASPWGAPAAAASSPWGAPAAASSSPWGAPAAAAAPAKPADPYAALRDPTAASGPSIFEGLDPLAPSSDTNVSQWNTTPSGTNNPPSNPWG